MTTLSTISKPEPSQTATMGLIGLGGALAASWVGLNLAFPSLAPTGIPSVVTRLAIHAAILTGLWLGLSRTEFSATRRVIIWLAVAVPFSLWLALVWNLALNGVFQPTVGAVRLPNLPIAIFAPVAIGLFVLLRSKSIAAVLDATPPSWLVALQVYRVIGGIFIVNWALGTVAGAFAWPAGIGDMLTGIMALPVAFLLASGAENARRAAIAWNIFGLVDFAIAITMGVLSTPGPLQIVGLNIPASLAGTYPIVMVPAFAVPSSILLHGLSIWQLRRIGQRQIR
jgi:hypothetical protein